LEIVETNVNLYTQACSECCSSWTNNTTLFNKEKTRTLCSCV